jgi:hypothetical protein
VALPPIFIEVLGKVLDGVRQSCPSRRIAALGYPDILASEAQLRAAFGDEAVSTLTYRPDSAEILRWHGATHIADRMADAPSLFSALGYELDVLDRAEVRGGEIVQDLNEPAPEGMQARYALVIDAGTLEHCFNIGQAACNVAAMAAQGGAIVHGNPLNMYNHGFYNLNPTWYHDFYGENGFSVELMRVMRDPLGNCAVAEVSAYGRFGQMPDNCSLVVVARRDDVRPLRWPTQRKYRENPNLKS